MEVWVVVFKKFIATILLLLLCLATLSFTQEAKEEKKTEGEKKEELHKIDLGEIIVTAKKDTITETAMVNEVTKEDIEVLNAQNLAEAVDVLPGIDVTVGSKNEHRAYLRGFDNQRITILLDGMPIYEPYYRSLDIAQLTTDPIEKIKVVRGGSSVLYGPDSMGGVINIITAKAKDISSFSWKSYYSNNSTHHHNLSLGLAGDKIGAFLSGFYANSDGFRLAGSFEPENNEDGGLRENSDYKRFNIFGKFSWYHHDNQTYSISLGYYDAEYGIPPHTYTSRAKYRYFKDWKKYHIDATGQIEATSQSSLKFKIFYHHYNNILQDFSNITFQRLRWESTYDNYSVGGIAYAFIDLTESHFMRLGLNIRRDIVNVQDDIGLPWDKFRQNVSSLAIEDEFPIGQKFFLVAGTSLDFITKTEGHSSTKSINPLIGFNYYLNPSVNIHGTISQKSRFPSLRELYSTSSGNPELEAEKAIISEMGISWSIQNHHNLKFAFFWNKVRNLIDRRYFDWGWGVYENIEDARMLGMEIFGNFSLTPSIRLSTNYTFLDAINLSKDEPLEYRPKHKFYADLRFYYPEYLNVVFQCSSAAQSYYFVNDDKYEVPSYTVNNLRVERQLADYLKIFLFIENLFDVDYYKEDGFPWRGRTFMIGINIRR
jgi:iron complex outermembrane receptor protein